MAQIIFKSTPLLNIEKRLSKTPMLNMHYHNSAEIFYIIKGEREYFVGDEFFKLEEGDMILIPKGSLHRTAGKAASRFLINFSPEYLTRYFTLEALVALDMNRPFVFRPNSSHKETLDTLFNSFYNEYGRISKEESSADSAVLAGYLYQILFTISYSPNTYVREDYSDSRIGSIVKYINENYGSISDIEEIANKFYISKYHLCRLFSKNLGVSIITYLNTIKIRKACEMIKDGKESITDIAMNCGFNSSSYFCKVFRAEKGVSPSEYKKQHKLHGK